VIKQPRDSVEFEQRAPSANDDPSNAISGQNFAQFKNSKLFQKFMQKEQTKATPVDAAQKPQSSVITEIAKTYKVNQRLNP